MNVKELLLKVKGLFESPLPVAPAADPTAKTFKLKDGSEISVTMAGADLAAADTVTIAGAPAPAADYELEDGTKITVDETGAITAVTMAEPLTQPDFVAPVELSVEDRLSAMEKDIASMKSAMNMAAPVQLEDVKVLQKPFENQLAAADQKISKQNEVIKGLFELVEAMSKEPSAEPVTLTEAQKQKFDKVKNKDDRLKRMAEAIKKNKVLN